MADEIFHHLSVLPRELPESLGLRPGDQVLDATLGGGGHAREVLRQIGAKGLLLGVDRDMNALRAAEARLRAEFNPCPLELIHAPFSTLESIVKERGLWGKLSAIYADIGVSSPQLDVAERGFSFMAEGPLDMRMDTSRGETASDILRTWSVDELTRVFRDYGEEPKARLLAQRLVAARDERPFETTTQLAAFIESALRYKEPSRKHPATRAFQALRIAVNDELGELETFLDAAFEALRPGGILSVISFHSLEDRLVKRRFQGWTGKTARENLPRDVPWNAREVLSRLNVRGEIVGEFPQLPSEEEMAANPRARSARLRSIRKREEA
jgi:16S rRNA (cytosine1402-N4)-methyltransferase